MDNVPVLHELRNNPRSWQRCWQLWACLRAIDFIKQFDLNRGEKSLLSQPAPSLGKFCRAGPSTGLCCISKQENETITGPAVTSWHRRKSSLDFIREKENGTGEKYHTGMSIYTFCLSLHFMSLQPHLKYHLQRWRVKPFTVMGQMTRKTQHSSIVPLTEQEQTSSCVAGRCFMGYLFFWTEEPPEKHRLWCLRKFQVGGKKYFKKSQKSEQITFLWGQQSCMVTIGGAGQVSFVILKI